MRNSTRGAARFGFVLAAGLFLAVAAGACGGRDDDAPPSPTRSPSPSAEPSATGVQPTATATPAPTATARPSATATSPPPTPTALPGGQLIEHGDRSSKMVALTFDMGGRVEPALDIVNWLIENRVQASIFMTGAMAENPNTDAGREVLRLIEANQDLLVLGNHSYSHPDFRELTATAMALELLKTETAISTFVAVSPRPYFRPPFGGVNQSVVDAVAAAGYTRTIMWDVDTVDWRPPEDGGPTAADIAAKVAANAQGGSIVIMHLGGYNTFEALPQVVADLRGRGFELVTLRDLVP